MIDPGAEPTETRDLPDRGLALEREADEDIAAGRVAVFDDIESFLADLAG